MPARSRNMTRSAEGFTLIELLIVIAIIAIIAAIAAPGLMRARMSGNEASAIGSIRTISSGEAAYSSSCGGGGYAVDLVDLALVPLDGGQAFIPADLGAAFPGGTPKSGYEFTVRGGAGSSVLAAADTCNGSTNDSETEFFAIGDPASTTSGVRFFGTDQSGHIRQGTAQIADITDGIPLQ